MKIVAGNASTILSLKSSPDDEQFILPFMEPVVKKGEIVNLPPYHFFMKMTTETSEYAFSGNTIPLDIEPDMKVKETVLAHSRDHYATPRSIVEEFLDRLLSGEKPRPAEPKKVVQNSVPIPPNAMEASL